jgi:hypothetical protein
LLAQEPQPGFLDRELVNWGGLEPQLRLPLGFHQEIRIERSVERGFHQPFV